jgi:tRNA threonylcarbamoyladenosine biosynthesis protein TsaB
MKVLGLDTATSACSAAVWIDGRIVAGRRLTMSRGQAEALLPLIMATLQEAGVTEIADLDRIAVTVGPGAFTGLRIALSAARGFSVATGVPVVGITTFDAVAGAVGAAERAGRRLLVAVDSRRAEPYCRLYAGDGTPEGEPFAVLPVDVAAHLPPGPLLVAGDGADALRAALGARAETAFAAGDGLPDAAVVAALGAVAPLSQDPPRPLYIRPPDVTPPKAPR